MKRVTMLDCINRVPSLAEQIVANRKETFAKLIEEGNKRNEINEIYLVGSGTSNTSSVTAALFVEQASGINTHVVLPNQFLSKRVYNPNALYVFVSQSGTSTLTQAALKKVKDLGCLTAAITGKEGSPLDSEADAWVNMGCGFEEFGFRTIGFCTTVLTEMMMAMEIGLVMGNITQEEYDGYVEEALAAAASNKKNSKKALKWFDENADVLGKANDIIIYGGDNCYGVAMEGALKILETAKKQYSVGYEIDDGLHGPTMGFTKGTVVVVMSDGGKDDKLVQGVASMMKEQFNGQGFIVGAKTQDKTDLKFKPATKNFMALEFAPIVQVLAYKLALYNDIPVPSMAEMMAQRAGEKSYFNTHDADKPEQ